MEARTHLARLYEKTGVKSQTALVRLPLSVVDGPFSMTSTDLAWHSSASTSIRHPIDKRRMWLWWKLNVDRITWPNNAAMHNNAHDPGLAHHPIGRHFLAVFQKARLEIIDLMAWITQTCQFDHGLRPEP